ncbi:unnamed protein product [Cylicostephanus goldi]|uniref:Uncharacterized protein n=1 Tax=Cylicostephanus goldi TaxID=71465 RepID=A0A3P7M8U0_CYLGO|nr:unnamed protein product [Cylicostephanus goldi]
MQAGGPSRLATRTVPGFRSASTSVPAFPPMKFMATSNMIFSVPGIARVSVKIRLSSSLDANRHGVDG